MPNIEGPHAFEPSARKHGTQRRQVNSLMIDRKF
jgi:hypothetical protein